VIIVRKPKLSLEKYVLRCLLEFFMNMVTPVAGPCMSPSLLLPYSLLGSRSVEPMKNFPHFLSG
jgi:hypothetical protein